MTSFQGKLLASGQMNNQDVCHCGNLSCMSAASPAHDSVEAGSGLQRFPSKRSSIVPGRGNRGCCFVALTAGIATTMSATLNSGLRRLIGSGPWTVVLCFGVAGLVTLTASFLSLKQRPCRSNEFNWFIKAHWYNLLVITSGLVGMGQSLLSAYIPSEIGLGLMVVGTLLGQMSSSVLVDRLGWFWVHRLRLSWWSVLGCLVLLAGSSLYRIKLIMGFFGDASDTSTARGVIFFLLSVLYGAGKTTQTALNRKLSSLLGARRHATTWAFCSGAIVLLPVAIGLDPKPRFQAAQPRDWWKFLGAPFALTAVMASIAGAQYLGFAAALCWQILGQLMVSLPLDHFGLLELERRPVDLFNAVGLCFVACGVAMTLVGKQRALRDLGNHHGHLILSLSSLSPRNITPSLPPDGD
eukprot:Gregarina_sp_Poly_1__3005@NODE_1844_length_3226_cov_67_757202_g1197_i0_p1_GENE_NODE_1844_length_3226_cov_67_757202_g1197_i0NODE_1844_length_3226_cov_67_757202_g1197_i0_p1_ORF_typecomplete_len410_score44_95DMT_YdcZ/PF04657_13/2_2e17DMT_YdcZ/PF04657_13/1_4e25CRTlike/PF08627_10/6_6e02CRTlike/PF08627_10/0_15CRTlike/PF08627_10/4_9UNC93/PF05978_16/4_6UNC93/PF05978_16/1e03UNC93/PF05978_16/1_9_NODE_1844_length_3226_cov_67_757202_g1197_i07922021